MCVDVSQDGHSGQRVRVPHTDVRIFSDLTRGHLDLIRVQSKTAKKGVKKPQQFLDTELFLVMIFHVWLTG